MRRTHGDDDYSANVNLVLQARLMKCFILQMPVKSVVNVGRCSCRDVRLRMLVFVRDGGSMWALLEGQITSSSSCRLRPRLVWMRCVAHSRFVATAISARLVQVLGLVNCADTIVGDGQTRGVSGGEKKRVTTGEIVVGPTRVLFMDEISTGVHPAGSPAGCKNCRFC
jgi:hypothetical protein